MSGPRFDGHAIGVCVAQLADFIDEAKGFSFLGEQNGGAGGPIQSIEKIGSRLCVSLDNLTSELNVTSQTLNRLVDSLEGLPPAERPMVLMNEETGRRFGGASMTGKKDGETSAPDVPDGVHADRGLQ